MQRSPSAGRASASQNGGGLFSYGQRWRRRLQKQLERRDGRRRKLRQQQQQQRQQCRRSECAAAFSVDEMAVCKLNFVMNIYSRDLQLAVQNADDSRDATAATDERQRLRVTLADSPNADGAVATSASFCVAAAATSNQPQSQFNKKKTLVMPNLATARCQTPPSARYTLNAFNFDNDDTTGGDGAASRRSISSMCDARKCRCRF